MPTKLDLRFKKGDRIRPKSYTGSRWDERTIEKINASGDVIVGGKTGPKYTDVVRGEVLDDPSKWEFACHHAGAPFEQTRLDEEGLYADGYLHGLEWGLRGQRYQAGGPYISRAEHSDCRHWKQSVDFQVKNNAAFRKGWAEGQLKAIAMKPINFDKAIRIVGGDERPVHYMGHIKLPCDEGDYHLVSVPYKATDPCYDKTGLKITKYGVPLDPNSNGSGLLFENVPESVSKFIAIAKHEQWNYNSLIAAQNHHADVVEIITQDGRVTGTVIHPRKEC